MIRRIATLGVYSRLGMHVSCLCDRRLEQPLCTLSRRSERTAKGEARLKRADDHAQILRACLPRRAKRHVRPAAAANAPAARLARHDSLRVAHALLVRTVCIFEEDRLILHIGRREAELEPVGRVDVALEARAVVKAAGGVRIERIAAHRAPDGARGAVAHVPTGRYDARGGASVIKLDGPESNGTESNRTG